jgi:uncharacterized protein YecE (DUF72 family)
MYYSSYSTMQLNRFAAEVKAAPGGGWCIFDNTARYAAWDNATSFRLSLKEKV